MIHRPTLRRLAAAVAVVLTCSVAVPASAGADDKQDKIDQKNQVDKQLEQVRDDLEGTNSDLSDAYIALRRTELEIPQAQEDYDDAKEAAKQAQRTYDDTADRLQDAEDEEEELTGRLEQDQQDVQADSDRMGELALDAYTGGGVPSSASIIVGAESPQDAVDRSKFYSIALSSENEGLGRDKTTQSANQGTSDRLTAVRDEISDLKDEAQEDLEEKNEAQDQAEQRKQDLDDLYSDQKTQTDSLEDLKSKYQDQESDLSGQSDQLDSDIKEIIEQEKKAQEEAAKPDEAPAPAAAASSGSSSGAYQYPVTGARLSSPFGYRVHPIYGTRKLHAGQDFAIGCGTPVHATAAGKVIGTSYGHASGNKVTISHGMSGGHLISSSYHHLQSWSVSDGQHVEKGQVIGYVGTTGSSTGCHLHFQMMRDDVPFDPMSVL